MTERVNPFCQAVTLLILIAIAGFDRQEIAETLYIRLYRDQLQLAQVLIVFSVVAEEWHVEQDGECCIPRIGFRQNSSRQFGFGSEICPDATQGLVAVDDGIVCLQILCQLLTSFWSPVSQTDAELNFGKSHKRDRKSVV